ncbi:arginine deiminase family protein, partial [Actinomyces wuliandei]
MSFSVDSEIGRLRQVILHRPGREMLRLTPQNKDSLLFDDVLWLERAQQEHDQFARTLTDQGAEVLYLGDLLTETLEVAEARSFLLAGTFSEGSWGPQLAGTLHEQVEDLPAAELADILVAGITKRELLERFSCPDSLPLSLMGDDDLLLSPLTNHLFTRDTSCWLYSGVSLNSMTMAARQRETINYQAIYRWHPRFAGADFPVWVEDVETGVATVEGGDV